MVLKYLIFIFFILLSLNSAYAQDTSYVDKKDFNVEIQKINDAMMQLKKSHTELKETVNGQNKKINDLHSLIGTKEKQIQKNVDTVKQETQTRMLDIDQKISVRTVLWIVITIIVLLVCGAVYIILRKKLVLSSRTLDEQIIKTRETLETEAMKLDNKLMEVLETQLQLLKEQPQVPRQQETEIDHSLALRVGEEIHRMRKRIENMPEDTKGLGALKNSLMRLEEEFNETGYEIINLLEKPYVDGLRVKARFVPSDDLKPGEEIITKIIKPQINYKGVLINIAEIEVSTGG
jgi:hypothetical protein